MEMRFIALFKLYANLNIPKYNFDSQGFEAN